MKIILFFVLITFQLVCFSQEKPLSEKEWKARCVQAKKQSEDVLAKFSAHDALVLKNYHHIFALMELHTRYEEYKRCEHRYKISKFKMGVLEEDTSGYPSRFVTSNDIEKAVKLSDSLYRFNRMREFRSLSDFRMKFDWIANYQTQDYNFIVTEYANLDKEMNKQLTYAANLILEDTLAQSELLERNLAEVRLCYSVTDQARSNMYFCLESLKARYLENPEGNLPPAYERYFSAYREIQAQSQLNSNEKRPQMDHYFEEVDEPAAFPGGIEAFREYVNRSLTESKTVLSGCEAFKVTLKFEISRFGDVVNVIFPEKEAACPKYVNEAMRIAEESPPWFPARKNGKTVSSVRIVELTVK